MSGCYLCGATDAISVLDKPAVEIWTDTGADDRPRAKYPCVVKQCTGCGHVYQPVNNELRALFSEIYQSTSAQGPSAMGLGEWGLERANSLFLTALDLSRHKSAIEIGCGDGYLLRQLKTLGFTTLIGIEPSASATGERATDDGVTIINDFVDEHLQLAEPVDLIYSVAVFEHIEAIHGVLSFCRNNIRESGELFFVVPNGQRQLERADPALFVHQHVHHFTEHSIRRLLSAHGLRARTIDSRPDVLCVSATRTETPDADAATWPVYGDYQSRLDAGLATAASAIATGHVLAHGACNALNNILGWTGGTVDVADNDENRQGRAYFHTTVQAPKDVDLRKYETVLIAPMAYFDVIRAQYLTLGFTGHILGTSTP